ncbi:unnamed protein product [Urochloa decumbens]|uniref:Ubiquitin-like protease family profile domain-containing protein n=1 Tax=Urochloa decumbens TaxID=240449 RepID=A0ABC9GXU4_9POAL
MLIKIVKRYNIDTKKFVFGGNELEISPYDVKCIMDLPVEGEDVKNRTRKPVDNTLFNSYKSNHKLELHTLEQNIRNSVVPDDDFKRQFVLFAIGTILAPTTKDYVDSKYLGVVENVQDLSRLNWGQFTLNHLLESIQMFTLKNQVNLQGNLALLQFWFWEHVQPHRRYGISYSSIPPPLMARWDEDSAKLRDTSFKDDQLDGGVVDMILQVMKQNQLDTEKKLSRIAMDLDHKIDSKCLYIMDQLAEIKAEQKIGGVVQTRVSKVEDHLSSLTMECKEDKEVAYFLRNSYEDAEVVLVAGTPLTVAQLKRNFTKNFMFGHVIDAFAYISNVQTDSTSVLRTTDSNKLTSQNGDFPPWLVDTVATKCLRRHMLFVPMHVHDCHWILLAINFIKEEVQVLDSLASNPRLRDELKECALVRSIQACIDDAVNDGLVRLTPPIKLTDWKIQPYPNIPQQHNNYSCGAFVLKYMLAWDGEKMAEHFTDTQVEVFAWKMCTRLLFSECNEHRLDSYKKVLTKEDYDNMKPKKNEQDGPTDDYVEVISDPKDDTNPKKMGSAKRKRGRPRKKQEAEDPLVQQFSTQKIAEQVQKKTGRVSKPGPHQKSPFKKI